MEGISRATTWEYIDTFATFTPPTNGHHYARQELQDCELTFPIIADASGEIFSLLGLVREDAIDPAKGIVPQVLQ